MDTTKNETEYSKQLLEQYKLYVQMADNISQRRQQANQFYISLLSALIAILAVVIDKDSAELADMRLIILLISVMGIIISTIWNININSYRQLNTGKFKVIHEMEKDLPYPCYDKEWEFLGGGQNSKRYFQLTRVERWIPIIFSLPYWLLFLYSVAQLLG